MNPDTPVFIGISQIQQRHSNIQADQQIGDEPIDMTQSEICGRRACINGAGVLSIL